MVVRVFFRKVAKETRIKRDIPNVAGTLIAGDRLMVILKRLPTEAEIRKILDILNTEEWEIVSPSKSKFNYRQFIKESRLKRK